jgi:hypothetical protein
VLETNHTAIVQRVQPLPEVTRDDLRSCEIGHLMWRPQCILEPVLHVRPKWIIPGRARPRRNTRKTPQRAARLTNLSYFCPKSSIDYDSATVDPEALLMEYSTGQDYSTFTVPAGEVIKTCDRHKEASAATAGPDRVSAITKATASNSGGCAPATSGFATRRSARRHFWRSERILGRASSNFCRRAT